MSSHSLPPVLLACLSVTPFLGCNGGADGPVGGPIIGDNGPDFLADPHRNGSTDSPRLVDITFGRLVDVHDMDERGRVSTRPVNRDFVINENLLSDGVNFTLETNPLTQTTRLVIHRTAGAPSVGGRGTYTDLLRRAEGGLAGLIPRGENDAGPFSLIPRNACLVLRFDDVLDDGETSRAFLQDLVRLRTAGPSSRPLEARIIFDANHGAVVRGAFHTTRLLVDLTISEIEALDSGQTLLLNPLGLPASDDDIPGANVVLRVPTEEVVGLQTRVLRGLGGAALDVDASVPADFQSPTLDIVRAVRSGNQTNQNAGFLLDIRPPEMVGTWPGQVVTAEEMENGEIVVDMSFFTSCRRGARMGDSIAVGQRVLEVLASSEIDGSGSLLGVRTRLLGAEPVPATSLLGGARFQTTYTPDGELPELCWLSISPLPGGPEGNEVDPDSIFEIRFSEPMEPSRIGPLEGFQVVRGRPGIEATARRIVVGRIASAPDLRSFRYSPVTSLDSTPSDYRIQLSDFTDLSGNRLRARPDSIPFRVASGNASVESRGIVMRFERPDEVGPENSHDLRGQFFFDTDAGGIRPRGVSRASANADPSKPVPSIMTPSPAAPQSPLSQLGSKLQTVWRYCDFGWSVRDESYYNLDVVGLNWAPSEGFVIADFFERFEIRLGHSIRLPEECTDPNSLLPKWPRSGLTTGSFADNALGEQVVVHDKNLGYRIDPAETFASGTGIRLLPWPMNRGLGAPTSYTWRDTSLLGVGGNAGAGVPLAVEAESPLNLVPEAGAVAPRRKVPSFGLPLLMEFRTFPDSTAIAQNAFSILLAVNNSAAPNFRVYSTGGTNTTGTLVTVDPEIERRPMGGFNPLSSPPGRRTPSGDNSFYIGQMDYVVRVSRAHSAWIDTRTLAPDFLDPVREPAAQPPGTDIRIEYRGASGFLLVDEPFDARSLGPYGELDEGVVSFYQDSDAWSANIDSIDGARYVQMRITFYGNTDTGEIPTLTALGIPFRNPDAVSPIDRADLPGDR